MDILASSIEGAFGLVVVIVRGQKGGKMTNNDIFDIFQKQYPEIKTIDYRPLGNLFRPTGYGITIWTERGDVILYFPKEGERREE